MSRNTSLPQDSVTDSNLEQHLSHAIGKLNASVTASASNSHSGEKQKDSRDTDSLLTKSAQVDIERKESISFVTKNIHEITVMNGTIDKYESLTSRKIQMSDSTEEQKKQKMDSPSFSGRIQPSQDMTEEIFSAMHPLHQLSDIALKQLEAVNQMATLQEDPKPAVHDSSPSQVPSSSSSHGGKDLIQTETKQVNDQKIKNGIKNGEKKVDTEKSKMKPKKDNLRKGKWTVSDDGLLSNSRYRTFSLYELIFVSSLAVFLLLKPDWGLKQND
jgi:hypothetical protein